MQHFDVIIIGGGLGGLSAGAFLCRSGKKVLLLEKHYIPGGCATTFKRRDYVMEAGLHAMDGHLVNPRNHRSLFKHLGIREQVEFIPIPEFFHLKGKNLDFTFPNGMEEATDALLAAFPDEEKGIRKFMDTINGVQNELSSIPRKFWQKVLKYPLFPFFFPNLFRTFRQTVGRFLNKHIRNPELKMILQANILYYHDDPCTMSMLFFAKAQASFIRYGGYFIRGGSQSLSDALAEVIRENGGKILLAKTADRILVDDGKAAGVRFRDTFNKSLDAETVYGNHIIHSGAVPLVKALLPEAEAKRIAIRTDHLKPATSLLTVYLGFNTDISDLLGGHYSTFFFHEDMDSLSHVRENLHGDWNKRSFVFVNYAAVDSGLTPPGKSFGAICTADLLSDYDHLDEAEYQHKKEEIAQILVSRLEKEVPGITRHIESYEVGTARTIRRYTLNPAGAPYGYAQTVNQLGWKRPAYKSPVPGLWFAGTWTFPGGGFTGAMLSGFLCGLKVSNAPGMDHSPDTPSTFHDPRQVKVLSSREPARESLELRIEKPSGFLFVPGQYAFLSLDVPGCTVLDTRVRELSLASHPDDDHLRFIMRKSNSAYKRSCAALKPGDQVTVFGPKGDFTLHNPDRGVVFLCSGIGITPVISMLRELDKIRFPLPVYLFNSNRNKEQALDEEWLSGIDLEQYRYIPVYTGNEGRLNAERIEREIPSGKDLDYYLVGSSNFISEIKEVLADLGVPPGNIHLDDFG